MTVLLRLSISLFPVFLFAYTFSIEGDVNVYSDKLYLDVFDKKWDTIPSKEKTNRAFSYSNITLTVQKKNYSYGLGYQSQDIVKINKGFVETWYYTSQDFNTLLKKNNIGYSITQPKIYGVMNYSQSQSIFLQKKLEYFNLRFSLLRGKVIQYMKINGRNSKNRFITDLDYYYSDKNILLEKYMKSNNYKGLGYSFDITTSQKVNSYEFFLGFFNILGAIQWKNIILTKYHFDSNTKYVGKDGYYHYRPFGQGIFLKTDFYQKLPFFLKYKIKKSFKNFFLENESMYSSGARFDTLFIGRKRFKIGYTPQAKNVVFGFNNKHFNIELSNNIKYHSKFIKLNFQYNTKP